MATDDKRQHVNQERLRHLPGVDRLLNLPAAQELSMLYGRPLVLEALRDELAYLRHAIGDGEAIVPAQETIVKHAEDRITQFLAPTLRRVINGTGVIIHTNLGRAPLSRSTMEAMRSASTGYSSLEYDLEKGRRGSRSVHASALLTRLTQSEDALVVNNNAAALLLMLTALCRGREVILSRGQLVEIGGGFRVPEVMAQSGARLVEVGTTNRTHVRDYEQAINENTGAILVAHHSNYQIVGYTAEPSLAELAAVAQAHELPLLYDQGSGALLDTALYGLAPEPLVMDALSAGVDVVTFSGDKLLGGPQAGILCGRQALLAIIKRHPLARAVRADKSCLAGVAATLAHYLKQEAEQEIPVWRMISRSVDAIREQASSWAKKLSSVSIACSVTAGESTIGGGSLPGASLPTFLLALETLEPDNLAASLRRIEPPIIGRIAQDQFLIDPRTILAEDEQILLRGVAQCAPVGGAAPGPVTHS